MAGKGPNAPPYTRHLGASPFPRSQDFMSLFGDIRSILHGAPSAQAWEEIIELLEQLDSPQLEQEILPYVHRAVQSWDDRLLTPPRAWLDRVLGGKREPRMALVRRLSLTHTDLEGRRFQELIRSPYLEHLTSLELTWPGLDLDQLVTLLYHRSLSRLTELSLEGTELGDGAVDLLCLTGFVHRLEILELERNELSDGAVSRLVDELGPSLRVLDLSSNHITSQGFAAICRAPHLTSLERLSLWNNAVGDEGVDALVNTSFLPSLRSLDLERNQLTDLAAELLLDWEGLSRMARLDLGHNPMSEELRTGFTRSIAPET